MASGRSHLQTFHSPVQGKGTGQDKVAPEAFWLLPASWRSFGRRDTRLTVIQGPGLTLWHVQPGSPCP